MVRAKIALMNNFL